MSITTVVQDSEVRITVTFTDDTTVSPPITDPDIVTFNVTEPDGTATALVYGTDDEVQNSAPGVYYVDWVLDQAGDYKIHVTGAANLVAAFSAVVAVSSAY